MGSRQKDRNERKKNIQKKNGNINRVKRKKIGLLLMGIILLDSTESFKWEKRRKLAELKTSTSLGPNSIGV